AVDASPLGFGRRARAGRLFLARPGQLKTSQFQDIATLTTIAIPAKINPGSTNAPSARQAEKRCTAPTQCSIRTNDQIEMIPSTPRVSVNVFAATVAAALGSGIEGTIAWYAPEPKRISSIAMARQICGTCDQATAA